MRWYWIVLLALLALVLLVVVVGALLPVTHQAACRIRLRQPAAVVFAVLTDAAAMPKWRSELKSVELLDPVDGLPRWREVTSFGPMEIAVEELVPAQKMVTRVSVPGGAFGGTWTWRLEPDGDGTLLTVTENGEVHNVVFRALSRFVFGHETTMRGYLRQLAAKFGEAVVVERGVPDPAPVARSATGTPGGARGQK
ncbi:MAG: SRPBCC family protein [Planctomycetes bacterium]|nr:SRPBCC family protein [Planctomycetota bacterium]